MSTSGGLPPPTSGPPGATGSSPQTMTAGANYSDNMSTSGGLPPPTSGPPGATGSSPQTLTAAPSYSDKLKVNVMRSERLKRNVLEINLESDNDERINLGSETIAKVLATVGIDIVTQVEGFQAVSKKLYVWLKDNVAIGRFCREESIKISEGVKTRLIKPMDRKEVDVKISFLNLNTPDSLVMEYLSKHGKVVHNKVIYDTEKEGPLKGLKNGDRRYLVDFSGGRNMGTYHLLDGARIQIKYAGQRYTCGRCHKTSKDCPGKGFARECHAKNGVKVPLNEHMKAHWEEIGFVPSDFKLEIPEDTDENLQQDIPIKDGLKFTPQHKKNPENNQQRETQFFGLTIVNLPPGLPDNELKAFLVSKGLPEQHTDLKIKNNENNTKVDIENLDEASGLNLIENLHSKVFFNMKIFCRKLIELLTEPNQE